MAWEDFESAPPPRPGRNRLRREPTFNDLLVDAQVEAESRPVHWNVDWLVRDFFYESGLPEPCPEVGVYEAGHERYATLMRQSFNFLRQHGDRRYSDTTLMRVVRAAEQVERSATHTDNMPSLVTIELPTAYDEDTEVKTGGLCAMAVCWTHNDGKTAIATHQSMRRRRYGSLMVRALQNTVCSLPAFWVSARNAPGQQFLLSLGLMPTSMNGAGAVRYSLSAQEEE